MKRCIRHHSLRGDLLRWMLLPLLLLWCMALALAWPLAHWLADQPFDHALRQQAQLLADTLAASRPDMPGQDKPSVTARPMTPVHAPDLFGVAGDGIAAADAGVDMDSKKDKGADEKVIADAGTTPGVIENADAGMHSRHDGSKGPGAEANVNVEADADVRTRAQAGIHAGINATTNAGALNLPLQPATGFAAGGYQVLDSKGRLLAGQRSLPPPPFVANDRHGAQHIHRPVQVGLRDVQIQGQPWRVAWRWTPAGSDRKLVQVAQPLSQRDAQASSIFRAMVLPLLGFLLLAAGLAWLALARGIRPLAQIEQRILARRPDDLGPLDAQAVPQELAPLVQSLNSLLARLGSSIQTQKRFLADAAHQLKTPLAGLRMQAELARRDGIGPQERKASLEHIVLASERATHTVNQLLALARAEGSGALGRQMVDLAALVTSVVQEAVPVALERGIDLGYDGPAPGDARLLRDGNPTLLCEMLRNMIDNALFYAPGSLVSSIPAAASNVCGIADIGEGIKADADAGNSPHTEITVRLRLAPPGGGLFIEVEDNGPGVPETERELIFQPFYRVLGTRVDGTGLGLSIVREIARQHNAEVSVSDTRPGQHPPGARFVVRFG